MHVKVCIDKEIKGFQSSVQYHRDAMRCLPKSTPYFIKFRYEISNMIRFVFVIAVATTLPRI